MIDFNNGALFKLTPTDPTSLYGEIEPLLIQGEGLIGAFKGVRDYIVFTNMRIIAVNFQGVTGKKKDYTSLPYAKVSAYSVETAGHFDRDAELELYYSGLGKVRLEFSGTCDIVQIGQLISSYCLK